MTWWPAALWAILAALLIELIDLGAEVERRHALPWHQCGTWRQDLGRPRARVYGLAALIRMACAGLAATGLALSGWSLDPAESVAVGLAALLLVERLFTLGYGGERLEDMPGSSGSATPPRGTAAEQTSEEENAAPPSPSEAGGTVTSARGAGGHVG